VPQQDLVDSYLPSFQTCVEEGKVSGIMWCVTCCSTMTFPNAALFRPHTTLFDSPPTPLLFFVKLLQRRQRCALLRQ